MYTDTRLYTLLCRSVRRSVSPKYFKIASDFYIPVPALSFATGLPCIWPCFIYRPLLHYGTRMDWSFGMRQLMISFEQLSLASVLLENTWLKQSWYTKTDNRTHVSSSLTNGHSLLIIMFSADSVVIPCWDRWWCNPFFLCGNSM